MAAALALFVVVPGEHHASAQPVAPDAAPTPAGPETPTPATPAGPVTSTPVTPTSATPAAPPTGDPLGRRLDDAPLDPYASATDNTDAASAYVTVQRPDKRARTVLLVHGGVVGFVSGMALVGPQDRRGDTAGSSVATGLMAAALGAGTAFWASDHYQPTRAQAAVVASGGVWGATYAGFITDLWTGVNDTTTNHLFKGTALGALVGTTVGMVYTGVRDSSGDMAVGDMAMVNSFGLYGTAGSLLVGVVLDPIQSEAYSVNGLIGATAGLTLGVLAARRWDASRARMLWIDAGATVGALAPWLAYPLVSDSNTGTRIIGGLSAAGLVAGGYLAWRLSRGMDRTPGQTLGQTLGRTPGLRPSVEQAESQPPMPGLLQRTARGQWHMAAALPRPLTSPFAALDAFAGQPRARGLLLDLAGGYF